MNSRLLDLTILVPSISPWNVWDLPLWLWRGYEKYIDNERANARARNKARG